MLRGVLRAAETPYAAAVRWRNHRFDAVHGRAHKLSVPVISVGNLTLGGTGKTPLVEWIVRRLLESGRRPAIVSRGFGAQHGRPNDEALELARALPDVPHLQNPDRVASATHAIATHDANVIVLDDGFQHRRLARELDIVLLDALAPFGYGHVFPRGLLREPIAGLSRAQAIVLSRADLINEEDRRKIRDEVRRHAPSAAWIEAAHAPLHLANATGGQESLSSLAGQRIAAFCGLGNPQGFRRTLEQLGGTIAGFREFPDHHPFTASDVAALYAWAQRLEVQRLVCTMKDLVKLPAHATFAGDFVPVCAVRIGIRLLAGEVELVDLFERALGP